MKKLYVLISALVLGAGANAQFSIGFESHVLNPESYDNGSGGGGDFVFTDQTVSIELTNVYDTSWGSWTGFSISNVTDNTTAGWGNQYSAFPGAGNDASSNYAVYYYDGMISGQTSDVAIDSFKITNASYAAISMRDGDAFAKQFGSPNDANGVPDGTNGEDYFRVWILCESAMGDKDSIEFYLADYRFADNTQDYIVDEWVNIDLSTIGFDVNKLDFRLESSDNGQWGMNTPAYFAVDDIAGRTTLGVSEEELVSSVYPNPAKDWVTIQGGAGVLTLTSLSGEKMLEKDHSLSSTINLGDYAPGVYVIQLSNASGSYKNRLIIQ